MKHQCVGARPLLMTVLAVVAAAALTLPPAITHAQERKPPAKQRTKKKEKPKVFDFTGLDISGRLRTPQLLYFLDRANEELERASLERRSFIPEMVRSLEEEAL